MLLVVTMTMIETHPIVQVVADQYLGGHTGHALLYLAVVTRQGGGQSLVTARYSGGQSLVTVNVRVTGAGAAETGAGH